MDLFKKNEIGFIEKSLGFLLAFSIFFPILSLQAILKPIKIPFIGIGLAIAVLICLSSKKLPLHRYTLILAGIYLFRGLYGTISGILQDAPGVYVVIPLSITYVVIHFAFMVLVFKNKHFDWLIIVLFFSSVFIVFLDLYYIMIFLGIVPNLSIFNLFQNSPTPFHIGLNQYKTLEFYSRNLGVLPFVFPFFIALLFDKKIKKRLPFVNAITLSILLVFIVVLMLLSGRRIFMLIMITAPISLFLFSRYLKGSLKKNMNFGLTVFMFIGGVGTIGLFSYTAATYNLSLENLTESFTAAFDSSKESKRAEQGKALIASWKKAPLFGHGMGASVADYARDRERPWAFEMGYHVSLHRLGIVGFAFELFYYLGIIFLGIKIIKRDNDIVMIGLLCGFLGFLLAHATNPFLNSYEFLWPIILPLFYINLKLLNPRDENRQPNTL